MSEFPVIQAEQVQAVEKSDQNLAEWIFGRLYPYVKGQVLEVNKDEGRIIPLLRQKGVYADVLPIDLATLTFNLTYSPFYEVYDMVIALHTAHQRNEHHRIIANCAQLLKKEGFLIIQLPVCTALYDGLAEGYNDWKYYNGQFMDKLLQQYFNIIKMRFYIVSNQEAILLRAPGKYRERVKTFSPAMASGFLEEGLCAIVIAQKY